MSDPIPQNQQVNEPTEFKNIPIEPPVGEYAILRKAIRASDVTSELHRFPRFSKHYQKMFTQSFYDTTPNLDFYDSFQELIKLGDQDFVKAYEEHIPQDINKRLAFAGSLSREQKGQYQALTKRYVMLTLATNVANEAQKRTHTLNRAVIFNLFESPNFEEAAKVFPSIPAERREKWHDLAMHFLRVGYSHGHAERLKRCFERTHPLKRGAYHLTPCVIPAQALDTSYRFWGDLLQKNRPCGQFSTAFRNSMVDEPNFEDARYYFKRMNVCLAAREHRVGLHAETLRNHYKADIRDREHLKHLFPVSTSWFRHNIHHVIDKHYGKKEDNSNDDDNTKD